ncbi:hypothetical protein [Microaerobacter geothermalis]|uniref:hypothetical protein n=1 Tax=Microaerobacter geothermalis TaxID=674972 RepID=UPI001F25E8B1|nr:hypothetical protein [Microaerobacter geothermalis]
MEKPLKPHGVIRFLIVLPFAVVLRFYLGEGTISFLWFILLYFPMINWTVYWIMYGIRLLLNKLNGEEWITVTNIRHFYIWYLNVPGSLALAELIYKGYTYNMM